MLELCRMQVSCMSLWKIEADMKVFEAIDVQLQERKVISLVGGGGKTSIMYRLAQELKSNGGRVLVTTTTHIYYPDKSFYDQFFWWEDVKKTPIERSDLGQASITVIGSRMIDDKKMKGIEEECVKELYDSGIFDAILIEADGAKGKPIKAPAEHEPVIPECTSVLIGVIGIDCYGKKIDPLWVHRPEILTEVTGRALGDIIDDEVIEKLVLSGDGLFKNCPKKAEKVLFINKAEKKEYFEIAQRIGDSVLIKSPNIKKVLIGSIIDKEPILSVIKRDIK
jgi:probable selenium-dependent hydroxylase accessory protein YqeC